MLVDTGAVVESRRIHDRPADGHRSHRPAVDLAHAHRLRSHRVAAHASWTRTRNFASSPPSSGVGIMGLIDSAPAGPRASRSTRARRSRVGHRTLTAFKPPAFDNAVRPASTTSRSGALFSADCFGALLPEIPQRAAELSDDGPPPRPDPLGHGRLAVAPQGRPWPLRQGVGRVALAQSRPRPQQPPPRRPKVPRWTRLLGHPRVGAGRTIVRRARPAGVGTDAGTDDWSRDRRIAPPPRPTASRRPSRGVARRRRSHTSSRSTSHRPTRRSST